MHTGFRWDKGADRYGSAEKGFDGHPLIHLAMEAFDMLDYLYYALKLDYDRTQDERIRAFLEGEDEDKWSSLLHSQSD